MHRIQFAILLLTTVSLALSGCHQTTGPVNSGALSPAVSPLAPLGQGQTPVLGPLGGSTRVTPPGTGSYIAPNNYMGGTAPVGQANFGTNPGAFAAQPSGAVIGSGVQVAGWSQTAPAGQVPNGNFGSNPSAGQNPRTGGMQVIDLTGAPAPPGYRSATGQSFTNQVPGTIFPNQNLQQAWQQQPQAVPQPTFQTPDLRPINTPSQGQIANSLTPVTSEFPPASQFQSAPSRVESVPQTATLPAQGPSTDPVNSNHSGGNQNLPWRRPGSTF